jgi:hypothetical protein
MKNGPVVALQLPQGGQRGQVPLFDLPVTSNNVKLKKNSFLKIKFEPELTLQPCRIFGLSIQSQ